MEEGLYFVLVQNHIFVGKVIIDRDSPMMGSLTKFVDIVEFIPMITPQGAISLSAVVLGEIIDIPKDVLRIKISKDSQYWTAYYKATTRLSNA